MQFQIEVVAVTTETKPTAKGTTYVMLDLAFRNLTTGKIEGKKLVPFGDSEAVYKVFKDAKAGNQFTVTAEKGEKFWQWVKAEALAPGAVKAAVAGASTPAPRSTYETPEERAAKQVYIVRQSSISNAVNILTVGAKSPPTVGMVLEVANQLTDWVFSKSQPKSLMELPDDQFEEIEVQ